MPARGLTAFPVTFSRDASSHPPAGSMMQPRSQKRLRHLLLLLTMVSLCTGQAAAQSGTIRGKVTAAGSMQPLGGAQVSVIGTGHGTLTNNAGDYLIAGVPAGSHSVRVQMIGYSRGEAAVTVEGSGAATLNFELVTSAIALDEIVVTGAGVATQKRSLGQSVATVGAEEFREAPISNVTEALSGRIPGLIANSAGETGQGAPIRLRGSVSLSQRNGPLIYVDGVRVDNAMDSPLRGGAVATNRLNDLNPNNIERVEVLKGAAAATLYGTEASAGVIQIFTRRGIAGEPQWEFTTTQQAVQMPDRIPDNVVWDAAAGEFATNHPSDDFVRTGHHQQYYLSVRGGQTDARYFASGWLKKESGYFPTNALSNSGVSVGLDVQATERLQTQLNLELIRNELRMPFPTWGLIGEFTLANPTRVTEARPYGELFHTVAGAIGYNNNEATNRYTVSGTARYNWREGLRSHATVGYNMIDQQGIVFVEYGIDPRALRGRRDVADLQRSNLTVDVSTAWEQRLSRSLASTFTVGAQSFFENSSGNRVVVVDYPTSGLETLRGGTVNLVTEDYSEVINAGIFAQEQLGLNDRLFLTAGVRVDGNSAFGDDFGFQTYPKAGASWTISEEPFWTLGFFDQLRLRAAYGTSGLQPGAYDALRTWRAYSMLASIPVLLPYAVGNDQLKPERSTEVELGADFAFLDSRAAVEATYFSQRTNDAILRRQLPPSAGFLEPQIVNIGELRSRGLETSVDVRAVESPAFRLSFNGAFSVIDQEVADLGGVAPIRTSTDTRRWNHIWEGYQPGAVIAPVLDRSNPYRTTVPIGEVTRLGQIVPNTVKNAAGSDSLMFVGNQLPTHTGSLAGTLELPRANLSLRALFRGEAGYVMLDQTNLIRTQVSITEETATMTRDLLNPSTTAEERARIAERWAEISPAVHSNWVQDAKNVRFQEVSLTWSMPDEMAGRFGMSSTSVTLAGRNLMIWTPYGGIGDPGASSTPTADFNQNIDYFSAPAPRRYDVTIRTAF
jgi:TonB-dependent SusC/RagA subfamily outer membrane receptor